MDLADGGPRVSDATGLRGCWNGRHLSLLAPVHAPDVGSVVERGLAPPFVAVAANSLSALPSAGRQPLAGATSGEAGRTAAGLHVTTWPGSA